MTTSKGIGVIDRRRLRARLLEGMPNPGSMTNKTERFHSKETDSLSWFGRILHLEHRTVEHKGRDRRDRALGI